MAAPSAVPVASRAMAASWPFRLPLARRPAPPLLRALSATVRGGQPLGRPPVFRGGAPAAHRPLSGRSALRRSPRPTPDHLSQTPRHKPRTPTPPEPSGSGGVCRGRSGRPAPRPRSRTRRPYARCTVAIVKRLTNGHIAMVSPGKFARIIPAEHHSEAQGDQVPASDSWPELQLSESACRPRSRRPGPLPLL